MLLFPRPEKGISAEVEKLKGRFPEFRIYHNFALIFIYIVGKHLYTHTDNSSLEIIMVKVVYKFFCEGLPNSAEHTS